jgi:hypothetical protein
VRTVVEWLLGSLAVAYYLVKPLKKMVGDVRGIITSWLERRSHASTVLRTDDGTIITTTSLTEEEIHRVLQRLEPPPDPKSEQQD